MRPDSRIMAHYGLGCQAIDSSIGFSPKTETIATANV